MNASTLLRLLLPLVAFASVPAFAAPAWKPVEEILFVVGEELLTRSDFEEHLGVASNQANRFWDRLEAQRGSLSPAQFAQAAKAAPDVSPTHVASNLILASIFRGEAARLGLTVSDSDVTNRLKLIANQNRMASLDLLSSALVNEGFTFRVFAEQVKAQMVQESVMSRAILVRDVAAEEVKAYYDKKKNEEFSIAALGTNYRVAWIFLEVAENAPFTEKLKLNAKAQQARSALDNGMSFPMAASNFSDDPATKNGGGELGWMMERDFSEEPKVGEALRLLKDGQTSPVVTGNRGLYLVKRIEAQTSGVLPFEKAQFAIKNMLVARKRMEEAEKKILEYKGRAYVQARSSLFGDWKFR